MEARPAARLVNAMIASHQVPVGQHLATTRGVLNAHRVLSSPGKVAENFRWPDPADDRDVHEVLRSEGIRFDDDARADPGQHLTADDLAQLIGDVLEPVLSEEDKEYGWRLRRMLRYLRHFYDAPDGRLSHPEALRLAIEEGYDPRGTAGFYAGTNASLRTEGTERVLTKAGRQLYEEKRHLLDG